MSHILIKRSYHQQKKIYESTSFLQPETKSEFARVPIVVVSQLQVHRNCSVFLAYGTTFNYGIMCTHTRPEVREWCRQQTGMKAVSTACALNWLGNSSELRHEPVDKVFSSSELRRDQSARMTAWVKLCDLRLEQGCE